MLMDEHIFLKKSISNGEIIPLILPSYHSLLVSCFFYVFSSSTYSCHCSTEYVKMSETRNNRISSLHLSLSLPHSKCWCGQDLATEILEIRSIRKITPFYTHHLYAISPLSLPAPDTHTHAHTHTENQHHSRNRFTCAAWLHLESLNQILDHSWWVSQRSMSEGKPVDEHSALGLLNPSGSQIQFETLGQKTFCGLLFLWPYSLKWGHNSHLKIIHLCRPQFPPMWSCTVVHMSEGLKGIVKFN